MKHLLKITVKFVALSLCLLVPSTALSTALAAQPEWKVGQPTLPYGSLGYPALAFGEIKAPPLRYERRTVIIPSSSFSKANARQKAVSAKAKAMVDSGRGQEALTYLKANLATSDMAKTEVDIANIYLSGSGGVPKNGGQGLVWIFNAAQKVPYFYYPAGNIIYNGDYGQPKNPLVAAHYWSKGARAGCYKCAWAMMDFWNGNRSGYTVPLADAFAYAVTGADIGYRWGLENVRLVLDKVPDDAIGDLAAASALKAKAIARVGSYKVEDGGLAEALHSTYRTGYISATQIEWDAELRSGKTLKAVSRLYNDYTYSRQRQYMIAKYFKTIAGNSANEMHHTKYNEINRGLAVDGLAAGDFKYAMRVAEIYAGRKSYLVYVPVKGERQTFTPKVAEHADKYIEIARKIGHYTEAQGAYIERVKQYSQKEEGAERARRGAMKCWNGISRKMHFSSDKTSDFIRNGYKQQCAKQVFEAADFYSGDKVIQDMAQEIRALNSADEASRVYYNAKRRTDVAAEKAAYASDARAYKKAWQACAGDSNCKYITYKRGK